VKVVLLVLLCIAAAIGPAEASSRSCRSVTFTAKLSIDQTFRQELGEGLLLRVQPLDATWFVDVVPAARPQDDYVYPVNPPLRFNGNQTLGPGYTETAASSLGHPHEMWFLLDGADFKHISSLIGSVLWPYQTSNPDKAMSDYSDAVRAAKTGWLQLSVQTYDLDKGGDLESIQFRVNMVVPADFALEKSLKAGRAVCPSKKPSP
jgi:hypothetical protein